MLDGLGIAGYKSFGGEVQRIGPFEKLNLIVGQNNSGKSNILSFLFQIYKVAQKAAKSGNSNWTFDQLDRPLGSTTSTLTIEFGLKFGSASYKKNILERYESQLKSRNGYPEALVKLILESKALSKGTSLAWFRHEGLWGGKLDFSYREINQILGERVLNSDDWFNLWDVLVNTSPNYRKYESDINKICSEVASYLNPVHFDMPNFRFISAIRKIGSPGSIESQHHNGDGLIEKLAQLQNPELQEQSDKEKFERINTFLRTVTGNKTATLEVPYQRKMILAHMDGKTLPLASLGTGIHEVVILAAAATIAEDEILCIEEPELHLHPLLQKKLLQYLSAETSNQYFITTHSAHLLDTPGVSVFHVRYQDGHSTVESAYTSANKVSICTDLGYRASDLLQANCVIWVEGPSDRIYLNHWIQASCPSLIENLHYSIMFYGGRLLSHLTTSDEDESVKEFISLRSLNHYLAIVIDSDRSDPDSSINETKKRIRSEFNQGSGFAWITQGREIENYIDPVILENAVKKTHPSAISLINTDPYAHCLHFKTAKGVEKTDVDKVKVAREVVQYEPKFDALDLKEMVTKLVAFICNANGIEPPSITND